MLAPGSGDMGISMDTDEESRLCRDERKLIVLAASRWSPSVVLLSLFLLLEKRDRPPDDCLDLSDDMIVVDGDSNKSASYLGETRKNGQVLAQGRSHDERSSTALCDTGSKGLPWQKDGDGFCGRFPPFDSLTCGARKYRDVRCGCLCFGVAVSQKTLHKSNRSVCAVQVRTGMMSCIQNIFFCQSRCSCGRVRAWSDAARHACV